jgi:hypothetical protein
MPHGSTVDSQHIQLHQNNDEVPSAVGASQERSLVLEKLHSLSVESSLSMFIKPFIRRRMKMEGKRLHLLQDRLLRLKQLCREVGSAD